MIRVHYNMLYGLLLLLCHAYFSLSFFTTNFGSWVGCVLFWLNIQFSNCIALVRCDLLHFDAFRHMKMFSKMNHIVHNAHECKCIDALNIKTTAHQLPLQPSAINVPKIEIVLFSNCSVSFNIQHLHNQHSSKRKRICPSMFAFNFVSNIPKSYDFGIEYSERWDIGEMWNISSKF